eukprot:TRINITY_DN3042_c1_g1_i2.p1 TRINITY_DN3042_c1_g1~~TRINITY_DN3042_c1_g1_i2.p1  ORF type:complete len:156 (+),score=29.94 TRINITY_DN3042_c1_g1_i2:179-646(+)
MGFRSAKFDPRLILAQIFAMQFIFYFGLGIMLWVIDSFSGVRITLDQIFDHHLINTSTGMGWIDIFSFFFNGIIGAFALVYVVERHRKCLDFAATVHLIHFASCFFYSGFPIEWPWWITNFVTLLSMAVLGEYLCMKRELQDIPLTAQGNFVSSV